MPVEKTRKQPAGYLQAEPGLGASDLREIEKLAAACVAADGGRLKLEWPTLQTRPPEERNDFLWIGPEGVVGFLGLYGFRPDQVEICGMVHPSARRRGVFSRLFAAARAELVARGATEALLVVDRTYDSGAGFARSFGGAIEHSEHRMVLAGEPEAPVSDPRVSVRPAEGRDVPFVIACLAEAFAMPVDTLGEEEAHALARRFGGTLVIELQGEPVGTVRVSRGDDTADIYGFAITPRFQGRGIGRQVLCQLVTELASENLSHVGLEVACTNDSALRLYASSGFQVTGTEDYYCVALGGPPSALV